MKMDTRYFSSDLDIGKRTISELTIPGNPFFNFQLKTDSKMFRLSQNSLKFLLKSGTMKPF